MDEALEGCILAEAGSTVFYFGTFNPVHHGHLEIARQVCLKGGFKGLVFVPAGRPPWKANDADLLSAAHRFEMLRLAIETNPLFTVDDLELQREGPSYTSETLPILRKRYNIADTQQKIPFIIGTDALAGLGRWHHAASIVERVHFWQIQREGSAWIRQVSVDSMRLDIQTTLVSMPEMPYASSDIRRAVREGRSISGQLPKVLENYIQRHGFWAA